VSADVAERTWEDLSERERKHLRDRWWFVLKNDDVEVSQRVPMEIPSEVMFARAGSTHIASVMDDGTELERVVEARVHAGDGVQLVKE